MLSNTPKHLTVAIFAALLIFLFPHTTFAIEKDVAVVINLEPDVDIQYSGKGEWVQAWKGMELREGDMAKCMETGRMDVSFSDGSVLAVMPNTTLRIKTIQREPKKSFFRRSIQLFKGMMTAVINKHRNKNSSFQFKTPTAVCGIRGTRLVISVTDEEVSRIALLEGSVEVYSPNFPSDKTILAPGHQVRIHKGKKPTKMSRLGEELHFLERKINMLEETRELSRDFVEEFYRNRKEEIRRGTYPQERRRPDGSGSLYDNENREDYINKKLHQQE